MIVKCKVIKTDPRETTPNTAATLYGLRFYSADNCHTIVQTAENLTPDKEKITCIKKLINENRLNDVHIRDILDDFMCV